MEKIGIKKFVEEYKNRDVVSFKEQYLDEHLEVVQYLPFLTKNVLASILVDSTSYKYEDKADENGKVTRIKTDIIKLDSTAQYILFCRIIIENYTNLVIETEGFHEEYDLLNSAGLLNAIMDRIPKSEIAELKTIVEMKQKDIIFNETTTQNFLSKQIDKISDMASMVLSPIINSIKEENANMNTEDLQKIINLAEFRKK